MHVGIFHKRNLAALNLLSVYMKRHIPAETIIREGHEFAYGMMQSQKICEA